MTSDLRIVVPLVATLTTSVLCPATARADDRQKQVLVLYSMRPSAQLAVVTDRELPSLLQSGLSQEVDCYSEYIDTSRFLRSDYQRSFRDFLRLKYKTQRIDLLIAVGDDAFEFLANYRDGIFPGTPVVAYLLESPHVRLQNSTGLVNEFHFDRSLELSLALQPDLKHVYVVTGANEDDRRYERQARRQFLRFKQRLEFTYLSGLVTRDLEAHLRTLPAHSAVHVIFVTKDGAGKNFEWVPYLTRLTSVAAAPTYSWTDVSVNTGIVGGNRRSQLAETKAIATLATRVLLGARADDIPFSTLNLAVNQVDWRELRRWGLDEALLPSGTIVLFRETSVWDRYRRSIIGSLALLLAQTMLIAALLVQRAKRRQSQQALRESETQLRESYDRIQHLGRQLLHEQEEERARVARELHDDVGQQIGCLLLELEMIRLEKAHRRKDLMLANAVALAHSVVKSVHDLSHQLHPEKLRLLGLVFAIRALVNDLSRPTLDIAFSYDDVPEGLPDDVALCLFRVIQEALQNVIKHSAATHAWVRLRNQDDGLALSVVDDGVGFNVDEIRTRGLGLLSMNERVQSIGGRLDIRSRLGSGTELEIAVPIVMTAVGPYAAIAQSR